MSEKTMLVMLEDIDPAIRKEMMQANPDVNALVVDSEQKAQPVGAITQMGKAHKNGDVQTTVYFNAQSNEIWVRVVLFNPFGFTWAKVRGVTRAEPKQ